MPHGYFTIEQLKPSRSGRSTEWAPVTHLNAGHTLSDALRKIEERDKPGLFRVVQMQRYVLAEKADGKLRLRKWHASSPESLDRAARGFVRDKGKWPGQAK
jgi:hypothetical protein